MNTPAVYRYVQQMGRVTATRAPVATRVGFGVGLKPQQAQRFINSLVYLGLIRGHRKSSKSKSYQWIEAVPPSVEGFLSLWSLQRDSYVAIVLCAYQLAKPEMEPRDLERAAQSLMPGIDGFDMNFDIVANKVKKYLSKPS